MDNGQLRTSSMENGELKMENEKNNSQLSTVNFQLPEGWDVKKLGEVYSFKNGVNFNKNDKTGDGILTIDVLNMYTDSLNPNLNKLYRVNKIFSKEYKLLPNDILIVRSSVKREGVAWATYFNSYSEEVTFCGFIIRGRPLKPIVPDYSVYYLRSPKVRKELINKSIKSTITNINQQILSEVQIPLPPLPEQKRIVKILDKAFEAIDKAKENAEKNLQNAKELFESYLNGIFANPGEDWEEKRLNEISENLDSKRIPITKRNREAGEIPYYGASGIVDYVAGYIFNEDLLCISEDGANLLARTYPIAFSISGKTWVNNHAHILRFKEMASQKFVELYLNSIKLEDFVSGMAQPKLNQTMLNRIPILFPPLKEQKSIIQKLDMLSTKTKRLEKTYQQKIADVEELKKSILQRAFEGKL